MTPTRTDSLAIFIIFTLSGSRSLHRQQSLCRVRGVELVNPDLDLSIAVSTAIAARSARSRLSQRSSFCVNPTHRKTMMEMVLDSCFVLFAYLLMIWQLRGAPRQLYHINDTEVEVICIAGTHIWSWKGLCLNAFYLQFLDYVLIMSSWSFRFS